jgi:hypothetical protein
LTRHHLMRRYQLWMWLIIPRKLVLQYRVFQDLRLIRSWARAAWRPATFQHRDCGHRGSPGKRDSGVLHAGRGAELAYGNTFFPLNAMWPLNRVEEGDCALPCINNLHITPPRPWKSPPFSPFWSTFPHLTPTKPSFCQSPRRSPGLSPRV